MAAWLLAGLCLGSFLNVVIHRLPRGRSVWKPGSRCPACDAAVAWHDNIPLISFVLLRGRCRRCRAPISFRYPAVELLGMASVGLAAMTSTDPLGTAVRSSFLLVMIAVAFIDLEHQIIPDKITIPGTCVGLAVSPILDVPRPEAALGLACGFVGFLLLGFLYRGVRGRAGLGFGDVKLAGMLGAFLGWKGLVVSAVVGSFVGSVAGLWLVLRGRAAPHTPLPYGTFLAVGAAVALLIGERLFAWYFTL